MEKIINTTDKNFEIDILKSDVLTLVDFWASWCAPCLTFAPVLEELLIENENSLRIVKINIDKNQTYAHIYGVQAIPTLLFFKNGKLVDRSIGSVTKNIIQEYITKYK